MQLHQDLQKLIGIKTKPKEFLERISNKIAVHRWANADEIADAYIFY